MIAPPTQPVAACPQHLRVLLVEDDAEDQALTRRALERVEAFRCDVRWARTYAEGADALRGGGFDLVLLDQQLGAGTGLALLADVYGGRPTVPVVLLTGRAGPGIDLEASSAGVAMLLEKAGLTSAALERSAYYALDRWRAERELQRARTYFRGGFDALQEHVSILDEGGRIVEVNAAWCRFAAANGMPDVESWRGVDYLGACDRAVGEGADAAAEAALGIRRVLAGEERGFQMLYPCHSPDAERWFVLRVVRFEDGGSALAYVAHHDVTVTQQAQRALRASEAQYRQLVETSQEGICRVDASGHITFANRRISEMLGYGPAELAGRPILEFVDSDAGVEACIPFPRQPRGLAESRELPFRRRDGTTLWTRKAASPLHDATGAFAGAVYMLGDITESRAAQLRLVESERLFRALTENSAELVSILDATGRFKYANPAFERVYGVRAEDLLGARVGSFVHPDDRASTTAALLQVASVPGATARVEYRARHAEGHWLYRRAVLKNLLDDPAVAGIVVNSEDVTDQRRAEETLRENEQRYRVLFERNPLPMWVADATTRRFLAVNEAAVSRYGYTADEFLAMRADDIRPLEDRAGFAQVFGAMTGASPVGTWRHLRKDGSVIDVEITADDVGFAGRPAKLILANDVTERVIAEAERERLVRQLELERARLTSVFEQAPAFIATVRGPEHTIELANRAYHQLVGRGELVGRTVREALPELDGQGFFELLDHVLATGEPHVGHEMPVRLRRADGAHEERFLDFVYQPITEADGTRSGVFANGVDVTHRVLAAVERERLLARIEEERIRLDALVQQMPFGVILAEAPSGRLVRGNDHVERIFGHALRRADDVSGYAEWVGFHEDGRRVAPHEWPLARAVTAGEDVIGELYRYPRPDEPDAWIRLSASPVRDSSGRIVAGVVAAEDVTGQREMAAALRASEEQLRQAQKMEAIGRLAGGIAHDFNNLLTVITSYTAMLLSELPPEDPIRADLREVEAASERAASLTGQLLAFSRQQVLSPRVVDVAQVVGDMEKMLRRLIGEDVDLTLATDGARVHVVADPGQLEQVVMNLAVNARDAMPGGGRLDVEIGVASLTADDVSRHVYVVPGEYVRVRVRDSGTGMDAATLAQVFEPFFTTKELGKGTGLGLATVYGIVKQSGGYVWVDSTLGEGTTFDVYLPRVADAPDEPGARAGEVGAVAHVGATVLLVEDEDALRAIVARVLRKRGYEVVAAPDGAEALAAAERHGGPIDVLVTDVVMPRMSGQELAERLAARRGEIPVLFMSGYSMDAVSNHGVLRPGAPLLKKPFTPNDIALAVGDLLLAAARGGAV